MTLAFATMFTAPCFNVGGATTMPPSPRTGLDPQYAGSDGQFFAQPAPVYRG